jgi:hypothetical protein
MKPLIKFEEDVVAVRQLANHHLGHNAFPAGIYPGDVKANGKLLNNYTPIPKGLGMPAFREFFAGLGVSVSDAYMRKFRDESIAQAMGANFASSQGRECQRPTVASVAAAIANKHKGESK